MFPAPRPHDGTLEFSIAPVFPTAVATDYNSAENSRADANFNIAVGGDNALRGSSSTRDVPEPTALATNTRASRTDRPSIVTPSGVGARFLRACRARLMAHHALITAIQVTESQAAVTATAASALHEAENH